MSFDSLLIQTCTIRRWTSTGPDNYGNPKKGDWEERDERCRISYPKGRQIQRESEVVPVDAVLFLHNVDVTERDVVILGGVQYDILFVAGYLNGEQQHHKELSLKRVIP